MTCAPGIGLLLVPGIALAAGAHAACLTLASNPDGKPLGQVQAADASPAFAIRYLHSVTRTPVEERYRLDEASIVQTEIRFSQHGPGLPTAADDGLAAATWIADHAEELGGIPGPIAVAGWSAGANVAAVVMEVTDELRELVLVGASALELRRKSVEEGMIPLRQSGLRKVKQGLTTLEEVARETVK